MDRFYKTIITGILCSASTIIALDKLSITNILEINFDIIMGFILITEIYIFIFLMQKQ